MVSPGYPTDRRGHPNISADDPFSAWHLAISMPQFECGAPDCDFLIRTRDPDEIVEIASRHARQYHDKEADPERIRSRIED